MLFNSYAFIFWFLPIAVSAYVGARAIGASERVLQLVLAAASLLFFWTAGSTSLILLAGSVSVNLAIGRWLSVSGPSHSQRRAVTALGVGLNISVLLIAKYGGMLAPYLSRMGISGLPTSTSALPLAISFYTFLQIAYVVDRYREQGAEQYSPLEYLLFVVFFPHLIAGPIVHHGQLIPQFQRLRGRAPEMWNDLAAGFSLFVIGLAKKVMIADALAGPANAVFNASMHSRVGPVNAGIGIVCYSLQIYFDFSGYSEMAIGLARLFGISLPANFRSPYRAESIVEFWRRWHITLSHFLREYIYIPLGGNRHGSVRRYCNVLVTMLLGGAWHGAGWTFVCWGGLHGLYLCVNQGYRSIVPVSPRWARPWYAVITASAVMLAWVFFRSADLETSHRLLSSLAGGNDGILTGPIASLRAYATVCLAIGIVVFAPNTGELFSGGLAGDNARPAERRARGVTIRAWEPNYLWMVLTVGCAVAALAFLDGETATFIYYKF